MRYWIQDSLGQQVVLPAKTNKLPSTWKLDYLLVFFCFFFVAGKISMNDDRFTGKLSIFISKVKIEA